MLKLKLILIQSKPHAVFLSCTWKFEKTVNVHSKLIKVKFQFFQRCLLCIMNFVKTASSHIQKTSTFLFLQLIKKFLLKCTINTWSIHSQMQQKGRINLEVLGKFMIMFSQLRMGTMTNKQTPAVTINNLIIFCRPILKTSIILLFNLGTSWFMKFESVWYIIDIV